MLIHATTQMTLQICFLFKKSHILKATYHALSFNDILEKAKLGCTQTTGSWGWQWLEGLTQKGIGES